MDVGMGVGVGVGVDVDVDVAAADASLTIGPLSESLHAWRRAAAVIQCR